MSDMASEQVLALRRELIAQLVVQLGKTGMNNLEIAQELDITPARVSKLMREDAEAFRLDMLVLLAKRVGLKVTIRIHGKDRKDGGRVIK